MMNMLWLSHLHRIGAILYLHL